MDNLKNKRKNEDKKKKHHEQIAKPVTQHWDYRARYAHIRIVGRLSVNMVQTPITGVKVAYKAK